MCIVYLLIVVQYALCDRRRKNIDDKWRNFNSAHELVRAVNDILSNPAYDILVCIYGKRYWTNAQNIPFFIFFYFWDRHSPFRNCVRSTDNKIIKICNIMTSAFVTLNEWKI